MNHTADRITTEALALSLAGPDGTLTLARLQNGTLTEHRSTDLAAPEPRQRRVGVWLDSGSELVRDEGLREQWRYWADLNRLPSASAGTIAILGESAARGYFHDPDHSVATLTAAALGPESPTIWDLARTNCSLEELLQTAAEARALGAETFVVHAGNNWNNVDPTATERQELAADMRAGGFPRAAERFRELVTDVSDRALRKLAKIIGDRTTVLVIPEFNLAAWSDEESLACPALPDDLLVRWRHLRCEAEDALHRDDLATVGDLAARMVEIDGGSSPVSARLLARCASTPADRRRALQRAKDSVVSPFAVHSPRTLTSVQRLMADVSRELGFRVVDQSELFLGPDGGPPHGEYFLDYCHLSFSGLQSTSAAIAAALHDKYPRTTPQPDDAAAAAETPAATRQQCGRAHFLAAVHNAHYGQPAEVVERHVAAAVSADEGVRSMFADYLDYQSRLAPNWMCASFERSSVDPGFARYFVAADGRLNSKLADHALRNALLDQLSKSDPSARNRHTELLLAEHGGEQDLLADSHLAATFNQRSSSWIGQQPAYHRAPRVHTASTFISDGTSSMEMSITWRLAGPSHDRVAVIVVNGHELDRHDLTGSWVTTHLVLESGLLHRGVNDILVRWPSTTLGRDTILDQAADRLECAEIVPSHPAHGHVADWSVRPD